jgi:hypothetical protein
MPKKRISVMPDLRGLSALEIRILEFVLEKWPTFPLEIAESLGEDLSDRDKKRRVSTKYSYYLKKLVEKQLLVSKKAGNSLIVWPLVVEKYRTIHGILKEYETESARVLEVGQNA